jgi:iron complex transport system permease protein
MMALKHVSDFWLNAGLLLLLIILLGLSLNMGEVPLNIIDAAAAVVAGNTTTDAIILFEIRLPRSLLAIMIGGGLGLSGAALQGLMRNPLADPGLIGVSGTAALGAVLALYFGAVGIMQFALPLAGMLGALLGVILIFLLAGRQGSILTLILTGVAINAFATALTSLALNMASSPYALYEIIFWLLGSLSNRSFDHVWLILPALIIGGGMLWRTGRGLDALTLGEETAQTLGVNPVRLRILIIAGVSIIVGASVSVAGVIGFVGLVVPHLLRPLVNYEPSRLLVSSALAGAVLLLAADMLVRLIPVQPELKLGVVTALLGGPFFLYLIHSLRRRML